MDTKIFNNIQPNWVQQYIKKIIHHNQVEFVPGMQAFFNMHTNPCDPPDKESEE